MSAFTIGVDIAKRVFQGHAIDHETGEVTSKKNDAVDAEAISPRRSA